MVGSPVCYGADVDVLVVDPGELGELLTTLLQQYGFDVARVDNGVDALSSALDHRPTVVVVEAELADTAGLDVAELCTTELGAVAIFTYPPGYTADPEIAARVRVLGASFARPFRSLSLIETVARFCGRPLTPPSAPLSSTEGYPVDTLADDVLSEQGSDEIAADELVLDDEVGVVDDDASHAFTDTALDASDFVDHRADHEINLDLDFDGVDPFADVADVAVERDDVVDVEATQVLEAFHNPVARVAGADAPRAAAADAVTLIPMAASFNDDLRSRGPAARAELVELEEPRRPPPPSTPADLAELWARAKQRRAATPSTLPTPATEGRLTPRVLIDLLDAFHQSQTTGELWLEADRGPGRRVLLLQRGVVVGARSNIAGEDLLSRLVNRHVIGREDADHVGFLLKTGQYTTVVGALLETELVEPSTLSTVVDEQVRRIAIAAFAWDGGAYRLTIEGRATREQLQANVHVGDIVVHAVMLTETDAALKKAAPDDARFAAVGDAVYGLEHLRLTSDEARVVVAMDGTKTIADLLVLMAPIEERVVRGLAAGLHCLHLARFAGRGAAAARKISFF